MSSYIPFEIQVKILEKLPVKPLLQFRSVCKRWKSTIDSSEFIADYTHSNTQPHNLVISYRRKTREEDENVRTKYVCFVDDDTFPKQKLTPNLPPIVNLLNDSLIISSSHGLICFQGYTKIDMVVIWNPSLRKSISIHVPPELVRFSSSVCFGVVPNTLDPKLYNIITFTNYKLERENRVEVFELSSGKWRVSCSNAPLRNSIGIGGNHVGIGWFIYWMGIDVFVNKNLIVSFDMKTEEFREIEFPDDLAKGVKSDVDLTIWNLNESLVVVDYHKSVSDVCDVWIMENDDDDDDDTKSFKKLYTIKAPDGLILKKLYCFRKSGEPLIEMQEGDNQPTLFLYQPCSNHFQHLEDFGGPNLFSVNSYTESLLLLHQRNNGIFTL